MSGNASLLGLFVGFLLGATGVRSSCPIELSPPSVVVRYGDPVSINCSTSALRFNGMGWEARQGAMDLQLASHLTWTVPGLTEPLPPMCYITPSADSTFHQCSRIPNMVLYSFPETISINSSRGGEMHEGEESHLTCDISNVAPIQNLTVRWYKGDKLVKTDTIDNPSKDRVHFVSSLRFTVTRRDNGVPFRCEAHLDLSPEGPRLHASSPGYNITVYFGPEVECSDDVLDQLEGESLERRCSVRGNPLLNVTWWRDGRPTDPAAPLTRDDAGMYTLEAEGATFLRKEMIIVVYYGPDLKCPAAYTALEDAPHNLTCTVEGLPRPETTWSKDGEEVELPEKLTRSDSGQYTFTASNLLTNVSATVEINVLYPPSQIVELEDAEVEVGSAVWLKCSSMGNPRPQYTWSYYRNANVREENEDGVSRLHIHNATAYDTGPYTCHANNGIGHVHQTATVTVKGARQECPVEITPPRMVVEYRDAGRHDATCRPTPSDAAHMEEVNWQLRSSISNGETWTVDTDEDWDPRPVCTAKFHSIGTCQKPLNFTLYKTPDSVSVRPLHNSSPVLENRELQLQCDITNVAPAGDLVVRWYRGNVTFKPLVEGSLRVTGCRPGNDSNCDVGDVRSPLNVSSTISITVSRNHSGAEFRCEAQLDLGPEGPQPPPNMMSGPLNITVYYKPLINTTKLPKRIPVFRGYPEELVCEADGHPPPQIQWLYGSDKVPHVSGDTLIVSEAGVYNCWATNEVDSTSYEVEVILKEDYLPLIAGFVAVTVVAISIVFLFIYSIYYKNTKMRRYSLKNPKLDSHSDNVAHNGWDMQFPMTKLS